MVARIQGFDASWKFHGRKTSTYRQIGNAFPRPSQKQSVVPLRLRSMQATDSLPWKPRHLRLNRLFRTTSHPHAGRALRWRPPAWHVATSGRLAGPLAGFSRYNPH
ncbi:DNA cytosine methyltransferase [Nesterenkonia pannonica]|uniref:DNA cytosine methyltransferase n=1 Tax=Nesterenkonia pannonica TaxID=1548602 RepID=UPI0021647190|nr:DNA cytosine methyltransferase [Nesterenkonia pannonica]